MTQSTDNVNHPLHYTSHPSGIECIQITEHMGYNLGNVIKYVWRADLKNDALEDLKKAMWYLDREIKKREVTQPAIEPNPETNSETVKQNFQVGDVIEFHVHGLGGEILYRQGTIVFKEQTEVFGDYKYTIWEGPMRPWHTVKGSDTFELVKREG